ncbi:MAG: LysE family translocator [Actinomycetota bacterium]
MDYAALISLAFVSSITPGPNNLMLWASGLNHGIRRYVPHLLGVSVGFTVLLFLIATGLGTVFDRYEAVAFLLKVLGGGYLSYLAYRIFTASSTSRSTEAAPPLTFLQAALFQWVNPKAWVMGTTAVSTLLDTERPILQAALLIVGPFWVVNLPCILAWLWSGAASSRVLDDPRRLRVANRSLGVLLGATVVLIVS